MYGIQPKTKVICNVFSNAKKIKISYYIICAAKLHAFMFQTPTRRLLKISVGNKMKTLVKKLIETVKAYEALNDLEPKDSTASSPQALMVLDTGKKGHIAGYGSLFNDFVKTQELGNFSGKGTQPVNSKHRNKQKSLLVVKTYKERRTKGNKKKSQTSKNFHMFEINFLL